MNKSRHQWKREEDVGIRGIFQGGVAVVLESWRWSLRPSFTPGRRKVILEAQFYTRQGGGGPWGPVLHQASGTNMVQDDNGC